MNWKDTQTLLLVSMVYVLWALALLSIIYYPLNCLFLLLSDNFCAKADPT